MKELPSTRQQFWVAVYLQHVAADPSIQGWIAKKFADEALDLYRETFGELEILEQRA